MPPQALLMTVSSQLGVNHESGRFLHKAIHLEMKFADLSVYKFGGLIL